MPQGDGCPDLLAELQRALTEMFGPNGAIAVLILLAATTRRFSLTIETADLEGALEFTESVLSLMPLLRIARTSERHDNTYLAGDDIHVVIEDAVRPGLEYKKFKQQMLSRGSAKRVVLDERQELHEYARHQSAAFVVFVDKTSPVKYGNECGVVVSFSTCSEHYRNLAKRRLQSAVGVSPSLPAHLLSTLVDMLGKGPQKVERLDFDDNAFFPEHCSGGG